MRRVRRTGSPARRGMPRRSSSSRVGGVACLESFLDYGEVVRGGGRVDVDIRVHPELFLEGVDAGDDGPGFRAERRVAPDPLEEYAQRPVAHRVPQEQAVAVAELVEQLDRDEAFDGASTEVVDVVVFRDDVIA